MKTDVSLDLERLACDALVYRAMRSGSWIDKENNTVRSAAFIRRHDLGENNLPKDVDGLSVNIAALCTIEYVQSRFRKCHGIATLHTGHIRDAELDVERDPLDDKHANIVGMPYQEGDNIAEAERFAGILAKQARLLPRIQNS